jgi:hypothetical protein
LKGRRFDYIILLSITQYFKDENELEKVVNFLSDYLEVNGKIIIADVINEHTSSIQDAFSLLYHCLKRGMLIPFARFIFYLVFSDYRKISKSTNLLQLSDQLITQISKNHSLIFEKIDGLTIHSTRTNYILTKI